MKKVIYIPEQKNQSIFSPCEAYSMSSSSNKAFSPIGSRSSCSRFSQSWHLHIFEHFNLFLLHIHRCVLHPVLHPHIVKCIMLSGAGGSSVATASY